MKVEVAIVCLALLSAARMTAAQSNFFVPPGGVGNWNDPANWTSAHLPVDPESAFVHAGRTANVDSAIAGVPAYLYVANFDQDGTDVDGTMNILPGADITIGSQFHLGEGAGPVHGYLNQSGGNLTVNDALFLAFDANDFADFNLSGGTVSIHGNLWFRFGTGTLTQTGGSLTTGNLVLAEGGDVGTASLYDLRGGQFNVTDFANIGKAPGAGDPIANSHGSMSISGGVATFGNLLFGNDPTDLIHISGTGVLRVADSSYSPANAFSDIAEGKITGNGLIVSTVNIGGSTFTQVSAVPEPTTIILMATGTIGLCLFVKFRTKSG